MNIRGPFHHVHLLSENPELTVRWYVENLGGRVFDEGNVRGSMRFRLRLGVIKSISAGRGLAKRSCRAETVRVSA